MSRRPYDREAFERFRERRAMHQRAQIAEALCNRVLRAAAHHHAEPVRRVALFVARARHAEARLGGLEGALTAAGAPRCVQRPDGGFDWPSPAERVASLLAVPWVQRAWRAICGDRDLANENARLRARVAELERALDTATGELPTEPRR